MGNMPGFDLYDDGDDPKGRVVAPPSTTAEAGGTYMEDKGPNDRVIKAMTKGVDANLGDLRVRSASDLARPDKNSDIYAIGDEGGGDLDPDAWLRNNDPEHPEYRGAQE